MPQKIRPTSIFVVARSRTHDSEHQSLSYVGALDHCSIWACLLVEGKSIAYKLGRSDRCAKSEFEFSRTFKSFELPRDVIANGDLPLKIAISFFTSHKDIAKYCDKSRPDPDSGCKKA